MKVRFSGEQIIGFVRAAEAGMPVEDSPPTRPAPKAYSAPLQTAALVRFGYRCPAGTLVFDVPVAMEPNRALRSRY